MPITITSEDHLKAKRVVDGHAVLLTEWLAAEIAAERERCAKIAEGWKSGLRPGTEARLLGHQEAAREIAAEIRGHAPKDD